MCVSMSEPLCSVSVSSGPSAAPSCGQTGPGGSLWQEASVERGPPAGSVPGPPRQAHPLTSHLRLLTRPALLHAVLGVCREGERESMRSWPSGPRPGAPGSPRLHAGGPGNRALCPELTAPHLHGVHLTVAGVEESGKGVGSLTPGHPRESIWPPPHTPQRRTKLGFVGRRTHRLERLLGMT